MNQKRGLLLALVLSAVSVHMFALAPVSELYPSGHWVYDAIMYLSLETGQTTLATNAPASAAELRTYLYAIPYESLGDVGRDLYGKVETLLSGTKPLAETGLATLDVRPSLTVSARYIGDTSARFSFESIEDFNDTKPFLSLPLLIGFTPNVTVFSDFTVREGYWASTFDSVSTNIPLTANSFDLNMPATAYVSAGNDFCTAIVGRGALSIGRTDSGSMILSDTADRLSYASLTLFSPSLRFAMQPIELATDRFAYYHTLSFRPLSFLAFTISETAIVHSTLDPRYLNPAMVFHSFAGWRDDYGTGTDSPVGTQLGLEADAVPLHGLRLYGQFVMNQFQTSYELSEFSDAAVIPNSLGGLAGAEYVHPYRNGYVKVTLEGYYSNPWLYILDNSAISLYASRVELVAPSGYTNKKINVWLGSPYGPDTMALNAGFSFEVPSRYRAGISWRYLVRGENGDSFFESDSDSYYPTSIAEAEESTPTGNASRQHTVMLSGAWFPLEGIEVEGKLGYSLMMGSNSASSVIASCAVTRKFR